LEANNPWRASTLEWSIASPAPVGNFGAEEPVVYRGAYDFAANGCVDFAPQHLSPELLVQEAD
jgi:cytochrome c oxidase subunit 1